MLRGKQTLTASGAAAMHAMDIYALAGAVSHGLLALLFALAARAQRARAPACFAVAYALVAAIYLFDAELRPATADLPNPFTSVLVAVAVVLITLGLVDYANLPERAARRARICALALGVLVLGGVFLGATRMLAFAGLSLMVALQAVVAIAAARHEPRAGHGLVGLLLAAYPLTVAAAAAGWLDPTLLRYLVIVPTVALGMAVLTTGLLRAQRRATEELRRREAADAALHMLNESLERRVVQRTAELHEVIAGLESFNRSVSHDLRGPLGGIAGVSRLAREALAAGDTAAAARYLDAVAAQAEASSQLVGSLLALARVSEVDLAPQPLDLDRFVRETLEQIRLAEPAGARLPVMLKPLPRVHADPQLLRQVYVNLVGNALKFSREAASPQVELGACEQDGQQVLYVRDNGVGFDAERADGLFEPFRRLHGAQRFQGSGVGLSIVKRIVERHGGRVWAQSQPDAGATFFFSLGCR